MQWRYTVQDLSTRGVGLRAVARGPRQWGVRSGQSLQWLLAQHRDLLEAEFALNGDGSLLVRGDDRLCVSKSPCSRCIQD